MLVDSDADSAADSAIRVFISYSHDSEEHAERVLQLADRLRSDGVDAWIDQYEMAPSQGWPKWMEDQVERARFVLCVCTETYRRRFEGKEDPGSGLGVTWEGSLARIWLYLDQMTNRVFIPVTFETEDTDHVPLLLAGFSRFDLSAPEGYKDLYRLLSAQPKVTAPQLGQQRELDVASPRLSAQPQRSLFGQSLDTEPENTSPLVAYGTWAKKKYSHLELIGIDAGDVQVKLEEVYVPLRVAFRQSLDGENVGMFRGGRCPDEGERDQLPIELERVFERGDPHDPQHVLIFGEPGSGKTTALLKLHQLCWHSPMALGLAEGTVPVFLRLRHFDKEKLDQGLAAFIDHEIYQLSGGRQQGMGGALWDHKRLLLLFDGLDEIADADHRAEVLQRIGWYLGHDDATEMRAVVTCRRIGLPGGEADRDGQFQTYEVRPFQDEQIAQLVTSWFREVADSGRITQATAEKRVSTILGALKDRRQSSQQILEMASNPLLLTLLCVVVLLGNEIPKKRVRFYEQCLDVLLDRWPRQRGKEAPLDLGTARDALGRLAFYLHSAERRDDLSWAEIIARFKAWLGDRSVASRFFKWIHGDVGVLVDYTDTAFGFVHLGIQEHLTARHLIAHPEDLGVFEGRVDESWWTEVLQQVSALDEQEGFDRLMGRLLLHTDVLERKSNLLGDCLRETHRPELVSFVRVLEGGDEARQGAVLRLLVGIEHRPPALIAVVEKLASADSPDDLKQLAESLLRSARQPSGCTPEDRIGLLLDCVEDQELAESLATRLRGWYGGRAVEVILGAGQQSEEILESCGALIVLVSEHDNGWESVDLLRGIYDDKCWLAVTLPGSPRPVVPEIFSDCEVLDWQLGEEDALIAAIIERLPAPAAEAEPRVVESAEGMPMDIQPLAKGAIGVPYTEPTSGTVFLPVPGGSFTMGHDDLFTETERKVWPDELLKAPTPACRVRLSPFWLASTPVTNEQYGHFLTVTEHEEPETWRDRRFSDPHQPVVNVSWNDAVAYCKWLSATNPDGYTFELPSEAQWEFAARGLESWMYPWGEAPPSDRLACYGLNHQEDKPAAVGSYPEGVGPFGHLDLAGLVWEWCCDAWEPDLSRWAKGEPLDPVGQGDEDLRPLRGGSWLYGADDLRSAVRSRGRPRYRVDDYGFRLLWCPPSLDP